MNTAQAAEKVQVSVTTVRRWCRTGRIQAVKAGRAWVIEPASLPTAEEHAMIKQVEIKTRRKDWRGTEHVTTHIRWQIEGTVAVITQERGPYGSMPRLTIEAGDQTVTVIGDLGGAVYKPEMRPVQVGDRVRVSASEELLPDGEYFGEAFEQL